MQRQLRHINNFFKGVQQSMPVRDVEIAFTGKTADTAPTDGATTGKMWVRKGSERGRPILVDNVDIRADYPNIKVEIAKIPGTDRYKVINVHSDVVEQNGAYAATLNQPLRVAEMLYDERVYPERMTNLRMYPDSGLVLAVEPGYYVKPDGTWVYFPGGTIDLTSDVPGTANEKALVLIGITYSTNTLTSDAQTAISAYTEPKTGKLFEGDDIATALNSAASTENWIGAIPLTNGQTTLKYLFQYTALGYITDSLSGNFVAKSGDTMTGALTIDGSADEVQLTVQGHSTQTSNPFVLEDSSSNDLITFDGSGGAVFNEQGNDADFRIEGDTVSNLFFVDAGTDRIGIGAASPTGRLTVSNGDLQMNGTATVNNLVNIIPTIQSAVTSQNTMRLVPTFEPSGAITNLFNINTNVQVGGSSSNNITSFYNLFTRLTFTDSYGGTVNAANGVFIASPVDSSSGSPSITTLRGLFIADMNAGTSSNIAIQTGEGLVDFGDQVEINTTTGGFVLPRMTTTQRNALTAVNGMGIYNTTANQFEKYEAGAWVAW